jgi:hypothetical protein
MDDYDKQLDNMLFGAVIGMIGVVSVLIGIGYLMGRHWSCG